MKWSTTAAMLTGAFALVALPAASQSLTDAAAKEKERRAKTKAGKTYTVRELQSAGDPATPTADASPKPGDKAPTEDEEQAKKQAEWRKRREVVTNDAAIWGQEAIRIQEQLNANNVDLYSAGRQRAVAALDEAKAKVAALQTELAALDEEGRRNRYR